MKTPSKLILVGVLAASLTLLIVSGRSLLLLPARQSGNDVEKWMSSRRDEIRDLSAPVPELLLSAPRRYWYQRLTDIEIRQIRDPLDPDARYVDLFEGITQTGLPWEYRPLLSTESLLIVKRHSPPLLMYFDPPVACWTRPRDVEDEERVAFWLKRLPVPTAICSTRFTNEMWAAKKPSFLNNANTFLQPDGGHTWNPTIPPPFFCQ